METAGVGPFDKDEHGARGYRMGRGENKGNRGNGVVLAESEFGSNVTGRA